MFDVTPDDIAQLNDVDLRELVGRLCEAELASRGLSTVAVTWGGNQTAPDGGLDVRVALPAGTLIDGYIPRFSTGFQVKKPDMAKAAILNEMRPKGTIRPVIQELANAGGAYVIISSTGSTADSALVSRKEGMTEALLGIVHSDQLQTDFYDRTRLATWVRQHSGLIAWVREKVGRALGGWHPYGPWSTSSEDAEAEYLLDDKLRMSLGVGRDNPSRPVVDAIDQLRESLAQPGSMVRLVGLSGVGKTRFAQALFDPRIGSSPLPQWQAVYTNLSDNPDPQPIGLASDLIANSTRAILIVDNCPPDLHARLSDLCAKPSSTVSVLTIEYDVRDDQPEGTQVATLDTSSPELIEKLVRRRFPHVSQVDARTIAEAAGGNARIAIALAGTVEQSETVAGLSDDELFQRLFRQRHDPNDALLTAAQACSLVYSFQGEAFASDDAELPRLAELADQKPRELYRHIAELLRRDLVQQRSVWRAVLPHAIANRLAVRALEDTPYDFIDQQLVTGGTERLAQSFSRRLSFLHDHPIAVAIAEKWMAADGLLGDAMAHSELHRAMFENVAPVSPTAALAVLERVAEGGPEAATKISRQYGPLLRSLAYDPALFERSVSLLVRAATGGTDERENQPYVETLVSLFSIYLSGTHATSKQRLAVVEGLLRSSDPKHRSLGLEALDGILEATHFSSVERFEFGARSRDYGYHPRSDDEITDWYRSALALVERLAFEDDLLVPELGHLLAQNFRGLWTRAEMLDELERIARQFAQGQFWREGWAECRRTKRFDAEQLSPTSLSRLSALEADLKPTNLSERVRAIVLGDKSGGLDLEDMELGEDIQDGIDRLDLIAVQLGEAVAADEAVFASLLMDLLRGGNRVAAFARGLARASQNRRATWSKLVEGLVGVPLDQQNIQIHRGYLAELWEQDRELAQTMLDEAVEEPSLAAFAPVLQSSIQLDVRGADRMKRALQLGHAPIYRYGVFAGGRATDRLPGSDLKELVGLIAEQDNGFEVALDILSMRLFSDKSEKRNHEPELTEAGRDLLRNFKFRKDNHRTNHDLKRIIEICLQGPEFAQLASQFTARLIRAVEKYETYSFNNEHVMSALLAVHPIPVLNALFEGDAEGRHVHLSFFEHRHDDQSSPMNEVSCEDLIDWCNQDRERRYPLAASFVSLTSTAEEDGTQAWSKQAIALLSRAPDPKQVLENLIPRFWPMSYSGSRAALVEKNALLLDALPPEVAEPLTQFIVETKEKIARLVARERAQETARDQRRDERFE